MNLLIRGNFYGLVTFLVVSATLLCACGSPTLPITPDSELASYQMEIDLLGAKYEVSVDSQGRLRTSVELSSADGAISLSIDRDTILLDKDGNPLQLIQATIDLNTPLPPENVHIVGVIYNLTPQGVTSNPPFKLTLSYDPDELPQGLREGDVYIAYYEDSKWDMLLYKQVDTDKHRVATRIDRFARYAVLIPREQSTPVPTPKPGLTSMSLGQALSSGMPTLAEFGWRTCQPCKAMKPILEELAVEYQGRLNVVIVEVYEHRDLSNQYGIMAIPTQIFFDSSGKEITRHMGFWPKEEMITQLQKIGID